jgi:hypothetical protein
MRKKLGPAKLGPAALYRYHITYEMYRDFGFSAVPEDRFSQLITRAGLYAEEQTLGRIKWAFKPVIVDYDDYEDEELAERNMRGICEIAELFFRNEAAVGETGAAIIHFSNEGYSETYEGGAREQGQNLFHERMTRILFAYFTQAQLSRRGDV